MVLLFFERGMRNPIATIKTTAGIFHEDRYIPLFQAAINLIFSIVLVQYLGMLGVFLGTLISTLVGPFLSTPYLVYKKVFKKSLHIYFLNYMYFCAIGIVAYIITNYICSLLMFDNFMNLIIKTCVCIIIPNLFYAFIFHKTEEFRYIKRLLVTLFKDKLNFHKKVSSME